MSVLELLRQHTRSLHEETEQVMYSEALRDGRLTLPQFRHLLRVHYQYHQGLESALARHSGFFDAYDAAGRQKTPWLAEDFRHQHLPVPEAQPSPMAGWSAYELLGAAYVGEGSMLGAQTILRALKPTAIWPDLADSVRFYAGYGPQTGARWKQFLLFLEEQGAAAPEEVLRGAQAAFHHFRTLFEETR